MPGQPGRSADNLAGDPASGLQVTLARRSTSPISAYDIGQGYEVIVLYADERRVALRYAREDSVGAQGYTVHLDGLCTDPNLLALYSVLTPPMARDVYQPPNQRPYTYALPVLPAGKPIGVARGAEMVVAVVDTGNFMDTRSCNEWWQIRPGLPAYARHMSIYLRIGRCIVARRGRLQS